MAQKQVSFGIDARLHGLVQFAAKDRKLQRLWPWKQKEIVAFALVDWIVAQDTGLDPAEIRAYLPEPPDDVEAGGEPIEFRRKRFEPGTGTLSFKLAKPVEAAFERACHAAGTKKGKAVAKALRAWLRAHGYAGPLDWIDR